MSAQFEIYQMQGLIFTNIFLLFYSIMQNLMITTASGTFRRFRALCSEEPAESQGGIILVLWIRFCSSLLPERRRVLCHPCFYQTLGSSLWSLQRNTSCPIAGMFMMGECRFQIAMSNSRKVMLLKWMAMYAEGARIER